MKLFKRTWKENPGWEGGWRYEEVDPALYQTVQGPADLDLAALGALDKIRRSPVIKAYPDVCAYIDAVVSKADLKEVPFASAQDMRKIQVKAETHDKVRGLLCGMAEDIERGLAAMTKAFARAELAQEGEEKK